MHKITIVCSAHRENGLCNAGELTKILRELKPEVIFEEVRASDDWSLEAQAVTEYRKFKLCQPVHVDEHKAPENAAEIKRLLDLGFEHAAEASDEYRLLENANNVRSYQEGFIYLNSVDFAKTRTRMSEIEDEIIEGKAGDALQWWRQFTRRREIEMMRNIYAYCRENPFDTGIFLVGATHKMGIVKEIAKYASTEADLIEWNFAYGQIP